MNLPPIPPHLLKMGAKAPLALRTTAEKLVKRSLRVQSAERPEMKWSWRPPEEGHSHGFLRERYGSQSCFQYEELVLLKEIDDGRMTVTEILPNSGRWREVKVTIVKV